MTPSPTPNPGEPAVNPPKVRDTDLVGDPPVASLATPGPASAEQAANPTLEWSAAMQSLVGARFDDFELLQELGRGGMGVVYKARQVSLDRPVAVKMLLADHLQNPTVMARFLGEARAVAALDHPDIVKIYQIGRSPFGHYFAMEYVEGRTLDSLIGQAPLPVPTAVAVAASVARAMHYAHGKGVIHRDLKPGNIMIKEGRRAIIMDFGIAKVAGKGASVTQQGVVVGTPSFMSPEQATEGPEPVAPASDVYSIGAILYAMLTGHAPYEEKTPLNTILKVISPEPPPPTSKYRTGVPAALEQICMKALAKRPSDRYPTAQALADDLRQFRAGAAAVATPQPSPAEPKPAPRADWAAAPTILLVLQPSGRKIRLNALATVVGRSSECDVILRSSAVSKRHCQILVEDDQVWVEDLDSANGTFVNGKRVRRCQLHDGDKLGVAGHEFAVRLPSPKS